MSGEFVQKKLNNNLKLFYLKSDSEESGMGVAIPIWPVDKINFGPEIPHLVEHVLSRLETPSGEDLRDAVYSVGGVFDAATTASHTFYYLYSLGQDFERTSAILIDGLFRPNFRIGALEKSKDSIISEIAGTPSLPIYETLKSMMWKNTCLNRSIIGRKEDIVSANLDEIKTFHRKMYAGSNASVVIIAKSYPNRLEDLLSELPSFQVSGKEPFAPKVLSPTYRIFEEGRLSSSITFSFPTLGYDHIGEERYLFRLAAGLLSEAYVSELEKVGLIYQNSWVWNVLPQAGEFILELPNLDTEHTLSVARTAATLFDNWPDLKVTDKDFENVKKQRILALRLSNSLDEMLPMLTKDFCVSGKHHTPDEAIEIYNKANPKDTLKVASAVLYTKKPFIVVSMGDNSSKYTLQLKTFLDDYYAG